MITVAGQTGPRETATFTAILADFRINVLDIGQAVIHDTLALGVLVEFPGADQSASSLRTRLANACEPGLQVSFTPISEANYEAWVGGQGRPRYVVSLLARSISARHLARVTGVFADRGLTIDGINRLSGRLSLGVQPPRSKACVEFSARGELADEQGFRYQLLELASELDVDISLQEDNRYRRHRRLVAFDMDSTLIDTEVIDELAGIAGVGPQVSAITERAMHGEMDFDTALRQRVALLKGLDETVLADVARRLPLTEGARQLIGTLKSLGYKTAILSGGFRYFGEYLQRQLGIDYVHANELEIVDGKVTGRVREPIVDGPRKAGLLREIAEREDIDLQQVISVGDGANDLPMLSIAGLGIAFRAKPVVKRGAEQSISTLGLDGILYLLGIGDRFQ